MKPESVFCFVAGVIGNYTQWKVKFMADDSNTNFKTGDGEYNILRKILARLNLGISTSGGGGGGGGGAVTVADGADVAQGATNSPRSGSPDQDSTVIGILKAIFSQTLALVSPAENASNNSDTIVVGTALTAAGVGAVADASNTNPATSGSVISFLKGILSTLLGPSSNGLKVAQATAANLNATVVQATAASLNATVVQATAASLNATVVGNIGGFTTVIKDATAVTAAAYSAGNAVGGKRTLSNAVRTPGTGILQSVTILDRANQKAAMTVFIFDQNPTAATITDHAAFVFSTDDLNVIAQVNFSAGDYTTTNSKAVACISGLNIPLKAASGTSLYAAVVTSGTPTFANTTDFQVEFGIFQD